MTLKEKFLELAFAKISSEELRNKSVEVADEFAIGFADWCLRIRFEPIENVSVKKLLEIYKKEKGL